MSRWRTAFRPEARVFPHVSRSSRQHRSAPARSNALQSLPRKRRLVMASRIAVNAPLAQEFIPLHDLAKRSTTNALALADGCVDFT